MRFLAMAAAGAWHKGFFWERTLYVYEEGTGLMRFEKDNFELAPGGEALIRNRVYSALPLPDNTIILATKFDGLFIYDGVKIRPFKTQGDSFFKKKQIYTA